MKRVLLITGSPGTGKTTVLTKTVDLLKSRGYSVGGMISREERQAGTRVGFKIQDIDTQKQGWLAHINQKTGPQLGKYHVNLTDLEAIGAEAITNATETCDVIAIDEIGPMELYSNKFRDAVRRALESSKLVIAVVHSKANDNLVREVKARQDAEIFTVTTENRNRLSETIADKITQRQD